MSAAPARLFIASTLPDFENLVRTCMRCVSFYSGVPAPEFVNVLSEEDLQYALLVMRRLRYWMPENYVYEHVQPLSMGHANVRFVLELCAYIRAVLLAQFHLADSVALTATGYFIEPGSVKPIEVDHTTFRYANETIKETARRVNEWSRMMQSRVATKPRVQEKTP